MSHEAKKSTNSMVDSSAGSSGLQPNNEERVTHVVSSPYPYLSSNRIYYDSSTIRCQPLSVPMPTPFDFKIMLNVKDIKLDTLRISIVRHVLMINGEKMKRSHGIVFSVLWSKQFSIPYDTDVYNFTAWVSFEKFLTVYAPKLNPIINVAVHVANSSSEPRKKKIRTGHQFVLESLDVKPNCEFINVDAHHHVHVLSKIKKELSGNNQPGPSSAPDKPINKPGPSKKHTKIIPKKVGKKIQTNPKQGEDKETKDIKEAKEVKDVKGDKGAKLEELLKKDRRKKLQNTKITTRIH